MDFNEKLIKLLFEDSRLTTAQLATMLGASEEEVKSAISVLEKDGVIVKYSAIINSENLADERVEALIEVKVTPQKMRGFDAIAENLADAKEVKSMYLMSGGFDLAVFVEARSLREVAKFVSERLSTIEGVLSTATHFILKKYKIEGACTKERKFERQPIQL